MIGLVWHNTFQKNKNGIFMKSSMRTEWGDFPDVAINYTDVSITSHMYYSQAKAGDIDLALDLVNDYIDYQFIGCLMEKLSEYENIMVVPVHAEEQSGRNKIPLAYAMALQELLGFELNRDIVQAEKAYRTQSDGVGRLLRRVNFNGKVIPDRNYLIVDDVITQGGTLADFKSYIEKNGGKVVLASTLSGKPHSAKMSINKPTLGQLRKVAGKDLEQWWNEEFNYDFSKFTESEARYLLKQIHRYTFDTVRDNLIASRFADRSKAR